MQWIFWHCKSCRMIITIDKIGRLLCGVWASFGGCPSQVVVFCNHTANSFTQPLHSFTSLVRHCHQTFAWKNCSVICSTAGHFSARFMYKICHSFFWLSCAYGFLANSVFFDNSHVHLFFVAIDHIDSCVAAVVIFSPRDVAFFLARGICLVWRVFQSPPIQ